MKPRIEQRIKALEQRSNTQDAAPDVIELVPLTADGEPPKDCTPLVIWRREPKQYACESAQMQGELGRA